MACVAVVEAHFEGDPRCDLGLEPVRLRKAQAAGEEISGLVECGGGEHHVAEANALGEEPAGDEC